MTRHIGDDWHSDTWPTPFLLANGRAGMMVISRSSLRYVLVSCKVDSRLVTAQNCRWSAFERQCFEDFFFLSPRNSPLEAAVGCLQNSADAVDVISQAASVYKACAECKEGR